MRAIDLRLCFICMTIAVFIGTSYQNARWLRADYDSVARLYAKDMLHLQDVSARTPSPRIIFAGGSSVVYAVEAKVIERDLGIRVINMGMPSRIGSDANYFAYLLPHIREGDLVIYSNQRWWGKLTEEAEANEERGARRLADRLWELAKIDLPERNHVEWPLFLPLPDTSVVNRLRARMWTDPVAPIWQRENHGSLVQCPSRSVSFTPRNAPSGVLDSRVIARSGQFAHDAEARGAKVVFFETPIFINEREREKWSHHRKELRAQLTQFAPMLDATESIILRSDPSSFCDDANHIDDDARAKWSDLLSAQLRRLPVRLPLT